MAEERAERCVLAARPGEGRSLHPARGAEARDAVLPQRRYESPWVPTRQAYALDLRGRKEARKRGERGDRMHAEAPRGQCGPERRILVVDDGAAPAAQDGGAWSPVRPVAED